MKLTKSERMELQRQAGARNARADVARHARLILLLAAGMASQGAAFLLQADLLPPLGQTVWDTSFLLADQSLTGRIMHALVGYTAQPAGIQLVFYLATLLIIGSLMRLVGGTAGAVRPRAATASHPTRLQPGE